MAEQREASGPAWAPWGSNYFPWSVASGVALSVLFLLLLGLGKAGLVEARIVARLDVFVQSVVVVFLFIAVLSAAVRSTGRGRWGWTFLAGSFGSTMLASALWIQQGVPTPDSVMGTALILATYVAALPAATAGILFLNPVAWRAGSLARILLDALIIAGSVFFLAWILLLGDLYRSSGGEPFAVLTNLAFPVFDLLLVTIALVVAARVHPGERITMGLLLAGLVVFAATDSLYGPLALRNEYHVGHPIDGGYVVGMVLIGLAALRPLDWQPTGHRDAARLGLVGSLIPFAPVVLGSAAAAAVLVTGGTIEPLLIGLGILLIVLVVLRQVIVILENHRLALRLERAGRFKSDMLRFISHEASTPLTPMRIHLHLIQKATGGARAAQEERSLPVLDRNLTRLQGLVSEVLDLSRLEAGRFSIEAAPVDLQDLIGAAAETYRPQFAQRGLRFETECVPVRLAADGVRIGQVLDNLLSNALKFTAPGGHVAMKASVGRETARIEVSDTGVGMTPEQVRGLFTPFGRVHNGQSIAPGTGLGLYLSRGIVEQHQGRIWCESLGPGAGSRFIVELPLLGAAA